MDEQMVGPDLVLATETMGDRAVLTVRGELDAYSAPGLEDQVSRLLTQGVGTIVLDLSGTGFLDSSGLPRNSHRAAPADGKRRAAVTAIAERTGDPPARDHRPDGSLHPRFVSPGSRTALQ